MKMKKLLISFVAAAMALGGMALGAGTAQAADGDQTIAITGANEGDEFNAYLIGSYTDEAADGECATVDLEAQGWASDAIDAAFANATDEEKAEYQDNHLAWIANKSNAAQQTDFAKALEDAAGTDVAGKAKAAADGTVTLSVTTPGWYLVKADGNSPILVGTATAEGKTCLSGQPDVTLGEAVAKPSNWEIKKTADKADVKVGDVVNFTVTSKMPNVLNADTYVLTDTPSAGLVPNKDVVVTIAGAEVTLPEGAVTYEGTKTVVDLSSFIADYSGAAIEMTYSATVTKDILGADGETATNKVTDTPGNNDNKKVKTHNLKFTKVNQEGNPLAGAEFAIKNAAGKYLAQDADTKAWSEVDTADAATKFKSDEKTGVVEADGLAAGEYTIEETKVPDTYLQNVKPSFQIRIGTGDSQGLTADVFGLASNNGGVITVKNVQSITQLPKTGAAGIAMFVIMGLLLAGAAGTVYVKTRSTSKALRA